MILTEPKTLEEFFEVLNVDEELRPRYRKWLEDIVMKIMPKEKYQESIFMRCPKCSEVGIYGATYCGYDRTKLIKEVDKYTNDQDDSYNQALSDIKENIKKG